MNGPREGDQTGNYTKRRRKPFQEVQPPPPLSRSENVLEPHSAEVIFEQLSEWDLLEVNVIETFYTIKP